MSLIIRLQELGECVQNLINETQHLQNIFNICRLHEFMETKIEESLTEKRLLKSSIKNSNKRNAPFREDINNYEYYLNKIQPITEVQNGINTVEADINSEFKLGILSENNTPADDVNGMSTVNSSNIYIMHRLYFQ